MYLDNTVPAAVRELKSLNVELQTMGGDGMGGGIGGMFWRFLVAADAGVDRFIVRDCDSRLNPRERLAVEEWIQSGKRVHTLRDPNYDRQLNGGMWGGVKLAVAGMATLVRKWSNREAYMGDLDFLNQQVWPRADVKGSSSVATSRAPSIPTRGRSRRGAPPTTSTSARSSSATASRGGGTSTTGWWA